MSLDSAGTFEISILPAFEDNYLFVLHSGTHAVSVDPGDGNLVLSFLRARSLELQSILLTHHHPDHIGGLAVLIEAFPDVRIYASKIDVERGKIPEATHLLSEGDFVSEILDFEVLAVPGHTLGHIAYYSESGLSRKPIAFVGDTLFAAGCGRVFEGTMEEMHASLAKLKTLPEETLIYCAHEYTLSNLRFALHAEPGNEAIHKRLEDVTVLRSQGKISIPTNISLEMQTNPFLRAKDAASFAVLREAKNSFR